MKANIVSVRLFVERWRRGALLPAGSLVFARSNRGKTVENWSLWEGRTQLLTSCQQNDDLLVPVMDDGLGMVGGE